MMLRARPQRGVTSLCVSGNSFAAFFFSFPKSFLGQRFSFHFQQGLCIWPFAYLKMVPQQSSVFTGENADRHVICLQGLPDGNSKAE